MQFQSTTYTLPLIFSTVLAIFVALYVWQRRAIAPRAMALVVLALACAEWSFGYALEIDSVDLAAKIFWAKIQYLGIVTVPLAWAVFAYSYSTQGSWMTRRNVKLLSIVPLLTLLLVFTNELHGLIWTDLQIPPGSTFSALDVTYGLGFWVYWVYSNLLLLAGTRAVFRSFKRTKGVFRRQDILLLIAVLTPWVGNVIYVLGLSPIPNLDMTPFAFTISVCVFALGIYRFKLGTLAPVARDFVVEKMSDGMIVLDTQGNVVDINPSMQKALGVSIAQVIGRSSKEVFNAWPSLVEHYENIVEARDEIAIGDDESREWFELQVSPLVDGGDRFLGRVVTVRNITKRKQLEQKQRLNEEKYRTIYENVEDVIYETDNQSHLTSISPSIERRGGYQPEELLGRSVTEFFVHPEQYADLDEQMIKNGSVNDFEALLRRKDGNTVWVSITSHIVFDTSGQAVSTEGVLRDITERKQAEDRIRQMNVELEKHVSERTSQLQESNAYLTALIQTSTALNESLDLNEVLDRILVQVHHLIPARAINVMLVEGDHAQIVRRVGYQGLENIAHSLRDYRFPITWPTLNYMFTTRKSLYISDTAGDSRWRSIEGADWVRSFVGAPLIVSDETIGFLNAGHSEPNYLNAKHAFMLESLAHHASVAIHHARLLDELKRALEKEQGMRDQLVLADKLAALGKMVSVIAHEINNPIQTVKNSLYLLEDQILPDGSAREYLRMASVESNRIADLVAQLRGTYASGSKDMVSVDVLALLLEVHDLLAPQLKKREVEWHQVDGFGPYMVCAVRNPLKQVFINLCLNAMEAMEADHERKLTVHLHADTNRQRVGVGIHNSGPQIPEEIMSHIFEPFFTTKKSGTGLGLSISYDIIRQHRGEILVESLPEKGVTFTVWLPVAPTEEGRKET